MSELDFCEDIVISAEIVLLLAITHFFFMPECRTLDLVISKNTNLAYALSIF